MIDQERLVKTFTDIVQIYSPSGKEKLVAQFVAARLRNLGLEPFFDKKCYNVTCQILGNPEKEPLILNAHLDTVDPGKGIRPQIRDGVITSSGDTILGVDNKAAVAAILETAADLIESGDRTHHPLDLVFTVREESSTDGPRLLNYKRIAGRKGYIFDSEGGLGTIVLASPFYNRIEAEIAGRGGHTKDPLSGEDTLRIGAQALLKARYGQLDEYSTANLKICDKNARIKKIKKIERLDLGVNSLTAITLIQGEVRSHLESLLTAHTNAILKTFEEEVALHNSPTLNFSSHVIRENGGYCYLPEDPFVKQTEGVLGDMGYTINHKYSFGVSDANVFAEKGVQMIDLGHGGKDPHELTESISVEELVKLAHTSRMLALR